ncbi:MAG: CinA family protein [Pseudomonadota bacterium]
MNAEDVLTLARAKGVMIAAAESCTGGGLMAALTAIPGSSDVVDRGFVTYSNEAKIEMLGVSPETIAAHGAVSEETAAEMAKGALRNSRAHLTVSITGIAGPGGSDHKPEGMVCFGVSSAEGTTTLTRQFGPVGRDNVRKASVEEALTQLHKALSSS